MTTIPPQTTRRLSGGFMEATEDTEGIMENIGNRSTEVLYFEQHFEGEGVALACFVSKKAII